VLASAEVYDPILAAWSPVPAMGAARHGHSATVLEDGRVLVAGGTGTRGGRDGAALSSVEILDPTAGGGSWSPVEGGMTEARTGHQAVRLDADGSVLFIGGETTTGGEPAALATTERYDAAHKRWMPTPELSTPRRGHRATLLADGSVLVSGGDPAAPADVNVPFRAEALATAERYVVNAATWTAAPGLPSGRTGHQALRLRTGAVLVIGGASGPASAAGYRSVLSYAPDAGAWTTLGALATGRWDAAAVELADGRVLVAGGRVLGAQAGPGDGTDVLTGTAELLTL